MRRPLDRPGGGRAARPAAPRRTGGAASDTADPTALWPILQAGDRGRRDLRLSARPAARRGAAPAGIRAGGHTFVAELDGRLAGTYLLKPNQAGPGSRVANCGYMVASWARGRGLGEALCRHSLDTARGLGFRAMQFNSVVSTNRTAIAVWQRCGFAIVGTVPQAFASPGTRPGRHPRDAPPALTGQRRPPGRVTESAQPHGLRSRHPRRRHSARPTARRSPSTTSRSTSTTARSSA